MIQERKKWKKNYLLIPKNIIKEAEKVKETKKVLVLEKKN